ncbi:response regulator transcription factor [Modestobacter sp. VKM Ac-2986]|uniref:response regulator transcription factor n=1 Tax=Modestobacter sp. VKM Ac-2986 TaxID=3004140 RepID=UPI0022ABC0FC|nr:response regulator transcription factor [Modestobacter sp. VKM Ac-2986]MCZ2829845.1 response regulator transcription factor [Modestobacter sp. VKM Ac-2986]
MIEDRARGNGSSGAVVWVFDERRRVRDEVAGRLLALPFVARVEAVGDPASLMARLDNRLPDVLLVGTQRATDSGLSVATQVLRTHPRLSVLMLGAPDDADTVRAAVSLGARGFLRWDASPLELGLGMSRTGLRPEAPRPAGQLAPAPRNPQHAVAMPGAPAGGPSGPAPWGGASPLAGLAPTTVRSTVPAAPQVALSMREMQVLTGMSQGKSNAQIGRELYLSEDTIKTHARRLFRKLAVKDRAEAVATGFRRGMMT